MLLCDLPPFLAKRLTDGIAARKRSAVFGQYAACRIDALQWFGLLCGIAVLLFLFCMRLFGLLVCAFRVWTDDFDFLYVSEFLTSACGVSLLRERPALAKAQGLDPNAF